MGHGVTGDRGGPADQGAVGPQETRGQAGGRGRGVGDTALASKGRGGKPVIVYVLAYPSLLTPPAPPSLNPCSPHLAPPTSPPPRTS